MHHPPDTELVLDAHLAQWVVRTFTRILGLTSMVVGLSIILGGKPRFMSISYDAALSAPGAPWSWGAWALLGGGLITIGSVAKRPRTIVFGAWISACWAFLFAGSFVIVFLREPNSAGTPMYVYGFLGLLFGMVGGVHYAMHPVRVHNRLRPSRTRKAPL
ncbi:MAG: hypothetical protein ABIP03_04770 [Aquihabitans sp.]